MTKDELIDSAAAKANISKKEAGEILDAILEGITKSLMKGDKVVLTGFGVFRVVDRAARQGINPKTGEKIQIAASKSPKFKAGKALKEAVK